MKRSMKAMMWRGQLPVEVCTHDGSAANGQWYCLYLQEVVYGTAATNHPEGRRRDPCQRGGTACASEVKTKEDMQVKRKEPAA